MKHQCRESTLSEGAKLLRRVIRNETPTNQAAYAGWVEKFKPTYNERLSVLNIVNTRLTDG